MCSCGPSSGAGPRVQVSTDGGAWPCWSVDGRTLVLQRQRTDGRRGGADRAGAQRVGADADSRRATICSSPAATRISHRVLVRQGGVAPARRELRVVLEWFTELTRLVRLPA